MKKIVSALMAVIMMFSVLCLSAYAQEEDPAYQSAFSDYLASDGAYAEKYAEALANMYQNNPEEFLKALPALSDEDVMQVSYALTGFIDLDSLAAQLNSFAITNIDSSSNALSIVREIVDTKIAEYASLAQEQYAGAPARHNGFNEKIIRRFIDRNTSGYDAEFFELIGRAYQKDPTLFVHTVNDLNDTKVQYLAKGIAYGLFNQTSRALSNQYEPLELSTREKAILEKIEQEISNTYNSQLLTMPVQNASQLVKTAPIPQILDVKYTNNNLSVENENMLSITISTADNINTARDYIVEIYTEQGGISYLKDRFDVSILAGDKSVDIKRRIDFFKPSEVKTTVKIYNSQGDNLLASDTLPTISRISGKWSIIVILGDRAAGYRIYPIWSVETFDASGIGGDLFISEVLGRSESGASPLTTNGDTPTGTYTGYIGSVQDSEYSYGPYKVLEMSGVSGQIVQSGRTGIWIHGGAPNTNQSSTMYPLRVTYGCVRLSNENQLLLINEIQGYVNAGADRIGNIDIMESV